MCLYTAEIDSDNLYVHVYMFLFMFKSRLYTIVLLMGWGKVASPFRQYELFMPLTNRDLMIHTK